MIIELPVGVEERLRLLVEKEDRDITALVEEAVRQYLEASSITDVSAAEVSETQLALASELSGTPAWKGGRE